MGYFRDMKKPEPQPVDVEAIRAKLLEIIRDVGRLYALLPPPASEE